MDYTDRVSLQKALSDVTNLLSNIRTLYMKVNCLLTTEETYSKILPKYHYSESY